MVRVITVLTKQVIFKAFATNFSLRFIFFLPKILSFVCIFGALSVLLCFRAKLHTISNNYSILMETSHFKLRSWVFISNIKFQIIRADRQQDRLTDSQMYLRWTNKRIVICKC